MVYYAYFPKGREEKGLEAHLGLQCRCKMSQICRIRSVRAGTYGQVSERLYVGSHRAYARIPSPVSLTDPRMPMLNPADRSFFHSIA